MKRIIAILIGLALLVVACTPASNRAETEQADVRVMTVFRSPTCGCCEDWIAYMEEHGFMVRVEDVTDMTAVKYQYNVPQTLQSCHTATVGGYVIEGHVPVEDVNRLLAERPNVVGIAVPGMPIGSPGMETEGIAAQPYDVIAFDKAGATEVYNSYGQ